MNITVEPLTFAWWNTSLSPPTLRKVRRASDEEKQIAIKVIYCLLLDFAIDFLALGEISKDDVTLLRSLDGLEGYRIESGVSQSGKVIFDTCFIYRPDRLQISTPIDIDYARGGKRMKIAQKIGVQLIDGTWFYLLVSHWQSRRYCPESDADRHLLGIRLRDAVDDIIDNSESAPYIILLGDYNDEPFDVPLSRQLMATRDKAWVIKQRKKQLLYNPFWRHLSYPNLQALDYAGTYYYKKGSTTKWHTFDQIMVSSAFLGEIGWALNEASTGIIDIPGYLQMVKNKSIFDHLPVIATFARKP
ncbi:endonuclease/exonuclease/phosphatase family protein [Methylovulum psychrotolerans]|uniref:Endonuclease/exonuclease/phosphatase domain-containing protein n=1 Tax=Methylovulum psychrotolerans TaxID=1704499 RepID=A0A1Z4BXQ7_9GAMM|nr:endonuclease/exonuclease/phosphatase family protein [Methylovulum psychrotolerans]ASF46087.1 hypothetical protein CEK71_08330 [Methylovulum psychrotolerans]